MTRELSSDKLFAEYGDDPRTVASLPEVELRAAQNSIPRPETKKSKVPAVLTPTYRSPYPKYEGLGQTTDSKY